VSAETTVVALHGDQHGLTFTDPSLSGSASVRYVVPQTAISLYRLLLRAQQQVLDARAKQGDNSDSEWFDDMRDALAEFADVQGLAIRVGEDGDDPSVRQPLEGSVR
jgi:hypothetical protein